ncbi:MAG: folate-binding protein [Methylibium sp. NZG]|nr:MAG: folate-binding protein [Methylibium sp. NZG]
MNTLPSFDGSVALGHLGVVRARGADASKFLHGQLTNDFSMLGLSQARLAGFCSAKGRLQASFIAFKLAHDDVVLVCSASVLAATLKRLSMFVLRMQCKLSDATAELAPHGLVGPTAAAVLVDMQVWEKREQNGASVVRLPDVNGVARAMCVGTMALHSSPALALDGWRWLEVQSGLPTIEAATVDQFVPQMLNYELVGGVDFKKGCYPGQEIVARSQYRGTIKRRMFLFEVDRNDAGGVVAAGQEVFHSADPGQPAGMVANAAPRPDGAGSSLLVEVKLAALQGGSLHLGSPQGPLLRRAELPYEVTLETA